MLADKRFHQYQLPDVKRDLMAGITVGIVALPLAMAFAIASGVKPEYGIYTTIIAGLIVALLGGSRFQIAGPTGAFVPILLSIVLEHGYEDLLIAGFLAGILLVVMGLCKLGNLIKYIPRSVTIGFTSGIAVIIFTGQIANFFGLKGVEKKEAFHENILELVRQFHTVNSYSLLTAMIGLLLLIIIPKIAPRLPVLLVALVVPTLISVLFYPDRVESIGSAFGGISQSLPPFQFPEVTPDKIMELLPSAFVIAVLGGIESLLSAVVADGMTGKRHHSNRELIGQGVANLVTPLLGGIPATGAIARTATNIRSGAVSPLSGVFHSLFVLIILLVFAPFASYIPLASMAPILMIVAWNMSEQKAFMHILKLRSGDSLVLFTTFVLTVFVNITVAVQVGLLLAMISFIKRMGNMLEVEKVLPDHRHGEQMSPHPVKTGHHCPQLSIYTIEGPLFFGAADRFERTLTRSIHHRPKVLLLRMPHVSLIDATGESHLSSLVSDFQEQGGVILISGIRKQPMEMLKKSGLYDKIGPEHFFPRTGMALRHGLSLINREMCRSCRHFAFRECEGWHISGGITGREITVSDG
ncbi:sodium-independent anion transporter [Kroppenstedtia guangzhouensis]|uniref:Sodium-independent anion transporter n=1 Tax=Kroppenstedtia guangzhouensis TaxID=1274356 RepID=A0ABQ1H1X9_9BACL|nr:sodium-independent anion transporter [Kroppenstedtia guangzhouensis]